MLRSKEGSWDGMWRLVWHDWAAGDIWPCCTTVVVEFALCVHVCTLCKIASACLLSETGVWAGKQLWATDERLPELRLLVERFQQYVQWQSRVICVSELLYLNCVLICGGSPLSYSWLCSSAELAAWLQTYCIGQLQLHFPCFCPGENQQYFVLIDDAKSQQLNACILLSPCASPATWSVSVHCSVFKSNYACDNIVLSLQLLTWILTKA